MPRACSPPRSIFRSLARCGVRGPTWDRVAPLMQLTGPTRHIDLALDGWRLVGDELADAAAMELLSSRQTRGEPDWVAAVERLARTEGRLAPGSWDRSTPCLPGSTSPRCAQPLSSDCAPVQSAVCLILGSLLESYGSALGAKCSSGGMLTNHVLRRLRDTTTFVMELATSRGPRPGTWLTAPSCAPGWCTPSSGTGYLARGLELRLGPPGESGGLRLHLLVFSHVYLRSMARLGATPRPRRKPRSITSTAGWATSWARAQLLTEDRAQEESLYKHITRRRLHPDDDSRMLAQCLFQALDGGRRCFSQPTLWLPWLATYWVTS